MKIIDWLTLFKFRYHVTFILVILGALLFAPLTYALFINLIIVYISFNILLYGGLYILNDISDMESDKKHPQKKFRPLPAGKISTGFAWILSMGCIVLGLVIGYVAFGTTILILYVLFIVANQFYTRIAKKIPYVEIIANAITHPMRLLLGILLVSATIPYLLILAVGMLAIGFACVRRVIELSARGESSRQVLKYYSSKGLAMVMMGAFGAMMVMAFVNYPAYAMVYVGMIVVYVVGVFGIYVSKSIFHAYEWVWLH
jgi:4-hydroxybenzoate polyprenyltransferase